MVKRVGLAEAQRKFELLKLADELGNVAKACRQLGVSRDSFYRYRRIYESEGIDGLHGTSRRKPNLKNRLSPEIENTIVELAIEKPSLSRDHIQAILQKQGTAISSSGVGNVLKRHRLGSKRERYDALEAEYARKLAAKPDVQIPKEIAALKRRVTQLEIEVERQSPRRPHKVKVLVTPPVASPTGEGLIHRLISAVHNGDSLEHVFLRVGEFHDSDSPLPQYSQEAVTPVLRTKEPSPATGVLQRLIRDALTRRETSPDQNDGEERSLQHTSAEVRIPIILPTQRAEVE